MKKEKIQRIEHHLKEIYNHGASCDVGDQWQLEVMRRIRKIGPLSTPTNYIAGFEQFVWQLVPVTSVLIIIMGSLIAHFGFIPEAQLVDVLLSESKEAFSLLYMIGLG